MKRDDKIYIAYKLAVSNRKKTQELTANFLALTDTAQRFQISIFDMMRIVKARNKK